MENTVKKYTIENLIKLTDDLLDVIKISCESNKITDNINSISFSTEALLWVLAGLACKFSRTNNPTIIFDKLNTEYQKIVTEQVRQKISKEEMNCQKK